jgi:hypothetical protein
MEGKPVNTISFCDRSMPKCSAQAAVFPRLQRHVQPPFFIGQVRWFANRAATAVGERQKGHRLAGCVYQERDPLVKIATIVSYNRRM